MVVVAENIQAWQNHAVYGEYLIHKLAHSVYAPVMDGEAQIALGTRYFEHQAEMDRAKWYNGVGIYYRMQRNDIGRALESHHVALALADGVQRPSLVGRKALTSTSLILSKTGNHIEAQKYARQAQGYAEILGNIAGQAYALCIEAKCWMALSDFRYAADLCNRSRTLLESSGLQGGTLDIFVQQQEAEIHLLKTEYKEARHIHETTINSIPPGQPPTINTVLSHLNLALIYIATEASPELVNKHLDISRQHFNTTFAYPTGRLYCDMAHADLYLRTGQPVAARLLLEECYAAARGKLEEGATFCLERLADLSHGLNDQYTTAHWANVYLGSALKSKDSLAMMKAIKCFGEIFLSNGDNQTALNLFTVALGGFTFMDVHRWKGTCMIRIADILAARGEFLKSREFWTSGRVLLARCSQVTDTALVDAKLETLKLCQRMD
ncbi:CTLH domain-containing protein [Mycena venus]|uniref:CTLH domain-containing protein n=1 Tax=Mycena venus TaxID=2733690 RepID=A0A8H6Y253_9AGAR|nr:CTLH domain-containing protein [Mycena venus]